MNFSLLQIPEIPLEKLKQLVSESLDKFQILKKIYDDDFVEELIKDNHQMNYLLWLLSAKNSYTFETLKEISENLEITEENDSLAHFIDKLKSKTKNTFNNYQLELYFASYYKKKGLNIELEPVINENGKNPDFKVDYNSNIVYFEAKNLYFEDRIKLEKFDFQLHSDLRIHQIKLVYSVYRNTDFNLSEYHKLRKFINKKLSENKDATDFPKHFDYFDKEGKKVAELVIDGKPRTKEYGYLRGIMDLTASEWNDRKKIIGSITSKLSQLVEDESNVVIVKSSQILTDYESIQDALFGDIKYRIDNSSGKIIDSIRYGDRVFSPTKNSRISAVLFYKKSYSQDKFEHDIWVFHNPYASKPIPVEFFRNSNVHQFAVLETDDTHMHLNWTK
ncbi:MAG: hypothetical protein ACTSYO_09590 [Candidatus Ranarchaeia archaeon]